ncbi:hypothetical protein OVA19_00155 [Streptomyces sp. SL203]|nr:hypothetical protein [Streptomyces sp. SL203]MCY1649234.1 hypothetical protein [Streptomyces sp. SL203]
MTAAMCALVRDVSPETLARHGLTDRTTAHRDARCAELWAAENRRRADRAALDSLASPSKETPQ